MHAVVEKLRELEASPTAATYRLVRQLTDRLERRDGFAPEHTAEVSRIAVAIAERLDLSPEAQRQVELGAMLHDVGKVSVRDRILDKPGPLTELERAVMRHHAVSGERLLLRVLDLPDVLAVVRWHHERWDGQGYPDGISGEQIPLSARIVAVADAFQAMIEPRPYREPRRAAAALAEIERGSGTQFDPACVDALRTTMVQPLP